jgi:general secretion pathway protein D
MKTLRCLLLTVTVWFAHASPLNAASVTLNLKDADISALINTVAEITNKNFIVDPRVKGKVTVISSRPMDSDEVYQVFLSILKVHGFAAIPSGAVTKIVPDVNAKQDDIPTATTREPGRGDEMVTRVVEVKNVAAAQLVPILRPLVPQQGHLAAYPSTNVLVISDRAGNVERLVTIIRRIDQVSDSAVEVIPLQHASAAEVVRVLTSLERAGGGGPGKVAGPEGGTTLVADERTNSVLLGGDKTDRLRLRALISHLDTPLETGGNTEVIYLNYAVAKDLVTVLTGLGKKIEGGEAQGKVSAPKAEFDIQADEAMNALVITAPPDIMRTLKRVISELDVRRAQVLVDAIIAEVSMTTARELGVQWVFGGINSGNVSPVGLINFTNTGNNIADVINSAVDVANGGTVPTPKGNVLLGAAKFNQGSNFNFAAVINMLASDSNTNILSTPTLVTLDNEEAEIIVGQNVPFITGSFSSTGAGGTTGAATAVNPFQTIQRQDVGLTLKIKPQINEGDALKLNIEQEVSSIAPSVAGASDIITNKRSIKTSVMVGDGNVVVLGGLIQEQTSESEQKVPLLGDIPGLGVLFRSKGGNVDKTNLMVFIHPVILRDSAVAAQNTSEKYDYFRALQLKEGKGGINLMPGKQAPTLPEWGNTNAIGKPPLGPAPDPEPKKSSQQGSSKLPWWYQ